MLQFANKYFIGIKISIEIYFFLISGSSSSKIKLELFCSAQVLKTALTVTAIDILIYDFVVKATSLTLTVVK